eukprot:scaffold76430_cov64-Phaeocystis_antarctica.AAC.6
MPELSSGASSGGSSGRFGTSRGEKPGHCASSRCPQLLERATCKVADSTAFGHPGATEPPAALRETPVTYLSLAEARAHCTCTRMRTCMHLHSPGCDPPVPRRAPTARGRTAVRGCRASGSGSMRHRAPTAERIRGGRPRWRPITLP